MNAYTRLVELSNRCKAIELGFLGMTKQVPDVENGQFQGMKTEANPYGIARNAAIAGTLGTAGAAVHGAVMNNYGILGGSAKNAYGALGRDVAAGFNSPSIFNAGSRFGAQAGAKAGGIFSRIKSLLGKVPTKL